MDFNTSCVDVLIGDEEIAERKKTMQMPMAATQTPWQEFYRANVSQLEDGGVLEFAVKYRDLSQIIPRHNH